MKKLTREELKNVKGGMVGPPGGGSGPILCNFTSTTCGDMCFNINSPGPYPPVSSCLAYLAYLTPSCHFLAHQVANCPVS